MPGDKIGPRQQWRASERVDNRATDPCSMLDSTTCLLPLCFLSVGLSTGSSTALRAYLTVPAWQRAYTPMSVPKVQKPLRGLVCVEKARGIWKRRGRMEDNLAHGSCLRPVDLEMRRNVQRLQNYLIFFPSSVSVSEKKNIFMSQSENKMNFIYDAL